MLVAIGLNRHWIEVRRCVKMPTSMDTKVVRQVQVPPTVYNSQTGVCGGVAKLELKSRCWVGGRVIATIPRIRFLVMSRAHHSICPEVGKATPLESEFADLMSNLAWRKQHVQDVY